MTRPVEIARIEEAAAIAGRCTDFGDPVWRPALATLLDAIESDAAFEHARWLRTEAEMVSKLATRGRVESLLRSFPEVASIALREPVFIVGLARTGTTLFHNTLAFHPELWAPPLWKMRSPVRPAEGNDEWERVARPETERMLDAFYGRVPEFRAIHSMTATGPDECNWLFHPSFATLVNAISHRIPSYVRWLTSVDMTPYYRCYRSILQLLQWQQGTSTRLVLKDPCHLWHLDSLFEVFPDATVLFLHRRMDEALPSLASLSFAIQRIESAHRDPEQMAPYCLDLVERGLLPALSLRRRMPSARIIDVHYRDLVQDLPSALVRACAAAGLRTDDTAISSMLKWSERNSPSATGRHRYTLEQFGFDRGALLERFRQYHDEYGLGLDGS